MKNKTRGSEVNIQLRANRKPASMCNCLMSSQDAKSYDQCCGIHGAMRERRGAKKATSAARRRNDKIVIRQSLEEYEII